MVREMEQEEENCRSKFFNFKHKTLQKLELGEFNNNNVLFSNRNEGLAPPDDGGLDKPPANGPDKGPKSKPSRDQPTEIEQMKERFAKLLLGEDMSGGGKGVSSALALSNAITNLAASVFGEQWRLEPMSEGRKTRWRKEIDLLLSIMVTRQRNDLHMNIPALRKLDAMLIACLDNFKDQSEFYYLSRDSSNKDNASKRKDDKWWLPTPKVPENGLSENSRKFMQYQKDCVNQVLKAAMAINAQNGRESLGDSVYRNITVEYFDPDQFLSTLDLSSEHKILDLKDRIEASIVIWKRKMNQKDGKSAWGSAVSLEKRELFEERAETILLILKHRFPGTPQSALDISKIQYNRDVGQAVLESYSRILESLAFTVMSRIEDVLDADYMAQNPSQVSSKKNSTRETAVSSGEEPQSAADTPTSMTLLDFMNWGPDIADNEVKKESPTENAENVFTETEPRSVQKLQNIATNNKLVSYLENIGGTKSPTARH
ncbi:Rop guanine nucleotide exchange factor 12, partial [Cucurbita argyrosperma subsp. sororia]